VNCSHMVYAGGCCNTVPLEGPAAQELRASDGGSAVRFYGTAAILMPGKQSNSVVVYVSERGYN
jgi:hypothetical protein